MCIKTASCLNTLLVCAQPGRTFSLRVSCGYPTVSSTRTCGRVWCISPWGLHLQPAGNNPPPDLCLARTDAQLVFPFSVLSSFSVLQIPVVEVRGPARQYQCDIRDFKQLTNDDSARLRRGPDFDWQHRVVMCHGSPEMPVLIHN